MSPTTGVVFRPQSPPEELRAAVEHAESAGVDELWLWEDCFLQGGLTSAAAALAWSSRLRVGVGLLPVPLRNPALAAMEIATLARTFPGRVVVALGHGVQDWMRQVGSAAESPMTLLREHTSAVRSLLAGERVDTDGRYVRLDGVALDWPPAVAPRLLLGARGPRTIALAGELTDGVLLDSVTDPEVVRRARGLVGDGHVAAYTPVVPGTDAGRVADWVAELGAAGADTVILQGTDDAPDSRPIADLLRVSR
jgi:alkanesulfonate monooxygenase SsuD/methylene tetrahydromethanopterin reductase-like flavin-dependent oxidoreductase (luciferase family)